MFAAFQMYSGEDAQEIIKLPCYISDLLNPDGVSCCMQATARAKPFMAQCWLKQYYGISTSLPLWKEG